MGKTSLWHGILIACLLSGLSVPLMHGLQWFGGGGAVFIAVLSVAYLLYVLAISPSRLGRLVLGLGSVVILIGACMVSPQAIVVGLFAVGLIWLVRTVLFYAGILPTLWDGALCTLSVVCALCTVVSTHRLWLAVWVFFLLQALFVYIPQQFSRSRSGQSSRAEQAASSNQRDAFDRAHRAAEAALHIMTQRV